MKDLEREAYDYANAMPVNVLKALSEFQQEVPTIHKGTKGYGYSYADLPTIFGVINPLMKKHGLGFTQLMQGTQLETIIFHSESGEYLRSIADIPQDVQLKGMNDFQVAGSAITYFRRYALSSALGLVTDIDNDASGEQKPKKVETPKQPSKPVMDEKKFNETLDKIGNHSEALGRVLTVADVEKYYDIPLVYKKALELREGTEKK